jgi:ribosomal protein S12 methylthiotransferase accessory factor
VSIGELLERYVLLRSFFNDKIVRRRTFSDTRIPRALLCDVPRFLGWQKEFGRSGLSDADLNSDNIGEAIVHTVPGVSLKTGAPAEIPLQLVEWGDLRLGTQFGADTYSFSSRTTSGAGGGFTVAQATLSALCEAIERDAFMIHWLNKITPQKVVLVSGDGIPARVSEQVRILENRGYQVNIVDITTDIRVPTCACVVFSPEINGKIPVHVFASCHPDPLSAVSGVMRETITGLALSFGRMPDISISDDNRPFSAREIGKRQRIDLWLSGQLTDKIIFMTTGNEISYTKWAEKFEPVGKNATKEEMLSLVLRQLGELQKVEGERYEAYSHEAQSDLLVELGYHVVKVCVPALMPLYLRETAALLDCERLRTVPQKLGHTPAPTDSYNPVPHPFP